MQLDVVISVFRETRASDVYSALASVHRAAPLRVSGFLHDLRSQPTHNWFAGEQTSSTRSRQRQGKHRTTEHGGPNAHGVRPTASPGKLRLCVAGKCESLPREVAAARHEALWRDPQTPFDKAIVGIPNVGNEGSAFVGFVARQLGVTPLPPLHPTAPALAARVAFLHAHTTSWHNHWALTAQLLAAPAASAPSYVNLNALPPPEQSSRRRGSTASDAAPLGNGTYLSTTSKRQPGPPISALTSHWADMCISDAALLCSAPTHDGRAWLAALSTALEANAKARAARRNRDGRRQQQQQQQQQHEPPPSGAVAGLMHGQAAAAATRLTTTTTVGERLCVADHTGKATAIRGGWEAWTGLPWPGHLRMDCCGQLIVSRQTLLARRRGAVGGRGALWRRLYGLALSSNASVPWEYLFRGIFGGDDLELDASCGSRQR